MKLARYKDADGTHFGLVANDKIHRLTFDGSAQALIAAGIPCNRIVPLRLKGTARL